MGQKKIAVIVLPKWKTSSDLVPNVPGAKRTIRRPRFKGPHLYIESVAKYLIAQKLVKPVEEIQESSAPVLENTESNSQEANLESVTNTGITDNSTSEEPDPKDYEEQILAYLQETDVGDIAEQVTYIGRGTARKIKDEAPETIEALQKLINNKQFDSLFKFIMAR